MSVDRPNRANRATLATSADEFAEAAEPVIEKAASGGTPASLLAVKLDPAGAGGSPASRAADNGNAAALREQVVELLRRNLRGTDVVAHHATEEVFVLLRGAAREQGYYVAGRLGSAIRNHAFAGNGAADRLRTGVTASMGVASAPFHGQSFDVLSSAARRAASTVSAEGGDGSAIAGVKPDDPAYRALDIGRFFGRTEDLATLRRKLDEAINGSPRVVSVVGAYGSGRSTLLKQLAPEVRLRGGSLVVARAESWPLKAPYSIWRQVLQALRRFPDAPQQRWHELTSLDPGMPSSEEARAGSKFRLLEELAEYIRIAARARPLVIILDEMQWVDAASWDALDHLLAQLERDRILIGLTIREDPAQTDVAERRRALGRIEAYQELRLSRLTRDEAKRWLESAMHHQEIGRELLAYIYRHTEGSPLAIAELMRCMVEERSIWHNGTRWEWSPPSELRMPSSIEEMVARRLGRLSAPTIEVLTTAAVIGREFEVNTLVEASAGDQAKVRTAIGEAAIRDILQPNYERGGGGQAFSHWKVGDVLLTGTPPEALAKAHERVARAMMGKPRSAPEVAVHFDLAGCQDEAYSAAMEAAALVEGVNALESASEYLELAARNATTPAALAEVRVRMAQVAETMSRFDEAEELCDLAIEWFSGQSDRNRALTLRRMRLQARKNLGEHTKVTLEALKALDAEAEELGNTRERVECLTLLSQTYSTLGETKIAEGLAAECVQMAERLGDPSLLATSLNRLAITVERVTLARAISYYERALDLFKQIGDVRGQARCYNNLALAAHTEGRYEEANKSYTLAISLARAAGIPDVAGLASLNLGAMILRQGETERARELFSYAMAQFAAVKNGELQLYAIFNMANLERELKNFGPAAELFEATASLAGRIGHADVEIGALASEGLCNMELGKADAARLLMSDVENRLTSRQGWFQGRDLVETLRIRLAAHDGRTKECLEAFDAALSLVEGWSDRVSGANLITGCAPAVYPLSPDRIVKAMTAYAHEIQQTGMAEALEQFGFSAIPR